MNNSINPHHSSRLQAYLQSARRSETPARQAEAAPQAEAVQKTPPASEVVKTAAVAGAEDLSQVEQQMIERYFPKTEAMTLRLYGANRSAQTINPGAVGGHLDLRG